MPRETWGLTGWAGAADRRVRAVCAGRPRFGGRAPWEGGLAAALALTLAVSLAGCASYERTRGVDNLWRTAAMPSPVVGTTTQTDILNALGPPSQVIGLRDQTVFYYLREQGRGRGAIFIVYNTLDERVTYDRAIFFFGADGRLQDYALSRESVSP